VTSVTSVLLPGSAAAAALALLALDGVDRSSVALVLGPFLVGAGWPGRRDPAGPWIWPALCAPLVALALRAELPVAGARPIGTGLCGLGLVVALASASRAGAGSPAYRVAWLVLVPGLAIAAWALDHGTATRTGWSSWSDLSPLGWWARVLTVDAGATPGSLGKVPPASWALPWVGWAVLAVAARAHRRSRP